MKNSLITKTVIPSVPPLIKGGFTLIKTFFFFSFIVLLLLACFQTKTHADATKVFRVSDGKTITFGQMLDDLRKVNIILVGEVHNQEAHHRLQLAIIKALNDTKTPIAVGFEMFLADNQSILDQWVAGTMSSDAFIKAYHGNWNFPWPLYREIFLYLRENKIPAAGLNISPEITIKVSTSGFSSLTKEELAKLPPETGCAVDEKYMKFIRRAYAMHGHGGKQFLNFCEAQLIWDQVMARNLIGFLAKNPDKTLVAVTGNGHAWKRGIPDQLKIQSEKTGYRVVLPHIPGYIEPGSITAEDADYILLQ
ncbi:MAG: ChaN family lipoprotein [Thermodesulfovibrionales bacterium]